MATRKQVRNTDSNAATVIESPIAPAPKPTPAIRYCLCGCQLPVIGKKARFVTGHDAKLKSVKIKQARDESNQTLQQHAKQDLADLGWSHFDKPSAAMVRKAERAAKAAAVVVEQEAEPAAATA